MAVTLRVYDSAKCNKKFEHYGDRYSLYMPTPRNKVKEWGYMGSIIGFSFNDSTITRCCSDVCRYGINSMNLGKKIKRESLPKHVQEWITKMENTFNKAIKEDTEETWEKWNEI